MALETSGLLQPVEGEGDPGLGMICGTMFGGVHSIASFDWVGITDGPSLVSPMDFPNTVINAPAGQAAIKHRLRGVNSTICAGLSSGLYAIDYAADFLRFGRARYLLAGGMEEVCEEAVLGFEKLHLNSPTGSARPFALDADGTVAGEGSAIWMLETEESAAERGVTPLLEICGFGASHDAGVSPSYQENAAGATSAIEQALHRSGIGPDQVGCIVASANGSRKGDAMEVRALEAAFGSSLTSVAICAPKGMTGEAMGASGALGAYVGGLALQRRQTPPSIRSYETLLPLWATPRDFDGEYALINAFSCDGNNASLVIRRWQN
jgi:3-oxoacyl-[acyl-carrier-protein] synthase II